MSDNLNYIFYKYYFDDLYRDQDNISPNQSSVVKANKKLINYQFKKSGSDIDLEKSGDLQHLKFRIQYPGLLMGLGYNHESSNLQQKIQNEMVKLGFSFDYVTGLPYLPGSSVKGILRSAFEKEKIDFIKNCEALSHHDLSDEEVVELEKAVFGQTVKENTHYLHDDVFFDAIVSAGASDTRLFKSGNLLDYEYITSHRAEDPAYDGLTAPNPVRLLKVRPGVQFTFRFKLTDSTLKSGKVITAEEKLQLFKETIELFGVGAKTNVGYGQLKYDGE